MRPCDWDLALRSTVLSPSSQSIAKMGIVERPDPDQTLRPGLGHPRSTFTPGGGRISLSLGQNVPMNLFGRWPLVICAGCIFIVTLVMFCETMASRDTVSSHVQRLTLLKQGPFLIRGPRDIFRRSTLQWLMLGRPTYLEWADRLEEEQQALVRLGYYDRKWFPWKDRDAEWESAFTNTAVWRGRYYVHGGGPQRPAEIRITARPRDVSEFDTILGLQLAKSGGKPQQVAAPNERQ